MHELVDVEVLRLRDDENVLRRAYCAMDKRISSRTIERETKRARDGRGKDRFDTFPNIVTEISSVVDFRVNFETARSETRNGEEFR
jgi:hypothetical protein